MAQPVAPTPPAARPSETPKQPEAFSTPATDDSDIRSLIGKASETKPGESAVPDMAPVAKPVSQSGATVVSEPLITEATGPGAYESSEETVRSQTRQLQAMHELDLGEKALMDKAYAVALTHFLSTEGDLPDRIENADAKRRANEGAMISEYYLAQEKMNAGDLEGDQGALALAQRAFERDRRFKAAERLIERIQLRIQEQKTVKAQESLKRRPAPDWKAKYDQTERWIQSAIQHIRVNELDDAETQLRKVLAIDPDNRSAIDLLMEVHEKRHAISNVERETTTKGTNRM